MYKERGVGTEKVIVTYSFSGFNSVQLEYQYGKHNWSQYIVMQTKQTFRFSGYFPTFTATDKKINNIFVIRVNFAHFEYPQSHRPITKNIFLVFPVCAIFQLFLESLSELGQ